MAEIKTAVVDGREPLLGGACLLSLRMTQPERLGFSGGQYVIVHSDARTADGKVVKRTYSIVSSDREQGRFELLVQQLPDGPGSTYMVGLAPGAQLRFSGPWGKKQLPELAGQVWLLATDSGLTAALGLAAGQAFSAFCPRSRLLFLQNEEQPLVSPSWLAQRLPQGLAARTVSVPRVGHGERLPILKAQLRDWEGAPGYALIAGDGLLLREMQAQLEARGVPSSAIAVEAFFNKPAIERDRR